MTYLQYDGPSWWENRLMYIKIVWLERETSKDVRDTEHLPVSRNIVSKVMSEEQRALKPCETAIKGKIPALRKS